MSTLKDALRSVLQNPDVSDSVNNVHKAVIAWFREPHDEAIEAAARAFDEQGAPFPFDYDKAQLVAACRAFVSALLTEGNADG